MNVLRVLESYPAALKSLDDRMRECERTLKTLYGIGQTFGAYGSNARQVVDGTLELIARLEQQSADLEHELHTMQESRNQALRAIGRLPLEQQVYITRRHLEGMNEYQAAASLGMPRATFQRKYRESIALLGDFLAHL